MTWIPPLSAPRLPLHWHQTGKHMLAFNYTLVTITLVLYRVCQVYCGDNAWRPHREDIQIRRCLAVPRKTLPTTMLHCCFYCYFSLLLPIIGCWIWNKSLKLIHHCTCTVLLLCVSVRVRLVPSWYAMPCPVGIRRPSAHTVDSEISPHERWYSGERVSWVWGITALYCPW